MAHGCHDITERCHMRKQRIILKHQPHAALMGLQIEPPCGIKPTFPRAKHSPFMRAMQPGNDAERG
jgi:hypothetical protein